MIKAIVVLSVIAAYVAVARYAYCGKKIKNADWQIKDDEEVGNDAEE